ncbi:uncharacterized protein [Ptychodera flava]|uniref:uncharacterized protein n=1 Tax=Ptychodera flava TaxID=63121 RepID=UPI00396A0768
MADRFKQMRREQLQKFLRDRGISYCRKKKNESIELAEKAELRYEVLEKCDHEISERSRRLVVDDDGKSVDLNGKAVVWDRDLQNTPALTLGDVFAYIVSHCKWTSERLSNYKCDDGYLMFKDGHVECVSIGIINNNNDYVYLKGAVKPEQRQTAGRYETWVLMTKNAVVLSAGCACVAADDGSCKHVTCLLFAVADFNDRRTDRHTAVGTDNRCEWSRPRRESQPVVVTDLDYRKDKTTPKKPGPTPSNYRPLKSLENGDIISIRQHMTHVCETDHPGALLLKLVSPPPDVQYNSVPSMVTLYHQFQQSSLSDDFIEYMVENTTQSHHEYLQNSVRILQSGRQYAKVELQLV